MRSRINLGLPRDGQLLFWGMFAWEFGIGLYNLLQTLYMEELGASPIQIGVLVGVQGIARVAVTLPSGILAERFSRRRLIVWTTASTVPAALFIGIAQDWWQLIPGMVLLMVGNLGTPAFSSYIVDISTPRTRARMFAMIYTVGPSVATIISPTLGGFIAEQISLRTLFFFSAAAYATSTLIFSRISERPLVTHHNEQKPSYREAFALPVVRAVALLKFGVLLTLMLGVTLLPNYLEDVHGLSIGQIGRLGSVYAAGSVILGMIVARIAWISGCRGIAIGTCLVGVMCGVTLLTGNLWILGPAFLMRGGFMVVWSLFHAVLGEISTPRLRSRTFALGDFLGGVGLVLAPFLAGALYDWRPEAPLLAAVILAPLLAVVAIGVERRFVAPTVAARRLEHEETAELTAAGA
ncbi:MAG: MFS transporter [Thermomicrobiales bacterium]|nr:MFS transporter [Thermomicrobiales bacterium]